MRKITSFFHPFLSYNCLWYSFLYLKTVKIYFHEVLPLVHSGLQILEFWRWKLWYQNTIPFVSGNIHIRESKKLGFTFSIEPNFLRTKFVWSHGLKLTQYEKIHKSPFQKIEDASTVFIRRIWRQSVRKKSSAEVRLIHAEQILFQNFIILSKKNRNSWRLNNPSKTFLNQLISLDFLKLNTR